MSPPSIKVRGLPNGDLELVLHHDGQERAVALPPRAVSLLVSQLLNASMIGYLDRHRIGEPGFPWPLREAGSVYADTVWPIIAAVIAVTADGAQDAAMIAAFGDTQVILGLHRSQLRRYAQRLLQLDAELPEEEATTPRCH